MSKIKSKEELISEKIDELCNIIQDGDGFSLFVHVTKITECSENDKIKIAANEVSKGLESDIFFSMSSLFEDDGRVSISRNLITNFVRKYKNSVIQLKPKGDA